MTVLVCAQALRGTLLFASIGSLLACLAVFGGA